VNGLRTALAMPLAERRRRMRAMRRRLRSATIFDWLESILERVDELAPAAEPAEAGISHALRPNRDVLGDAAVVPVTLGPPADLPLPERDRERPLVDRRTDDRVAGAV
jgi:hypothetical protein